MQPSDARFSLRFESGERAGETLVLAPGDLTFGRRPGNHVVLAHTSVSGKHAEIRVDGGGAEIVDLGSTNGTRVGSEKIDKARLAHGDRFSIGQVEFSFHDREVGGGAPGSASASDSFSEAGRSDSLGAGEDVGAISAERLKASGKKGGLGMLALLGLLALGGGGAAWWFTKGGGSEGGGEVAVVAEVPGNLLAHGTFEALEAPVWNTTDASTGLVELDRAFAGSGSAGLGADLESGEWFIARSPEFTARARGAYAVRGDLVADGGHARLGIELSSDVEGVAPIVIWSQATTSSALAEFAFSGMTGFETARVLFAGVGLGVLSLDDVVVVEEAAPASAKLGDFTLETFGGATTASVLFGGKPLFPAIQLDAWRPDFLVAGTVPSASGRLSASANETGFTLEVPSGARSLSLRYTPETLDRVATVSADGYRSHLGGFEPTVVDSVLLGWGSDLVQVGFPQPTKVSAERRGNALVLRLDASGLSTVDLRVDFQAVRVEARALASRADDAERGGRYGEALGAWGELLATYPYEKPMIQSAEAGRARRVGEGLAEIESLREQFERARFFELDDLFRQCQERASEIAADYSPSGGQANEVAESALALVADIDGARQALGDSMHSAAQKLERILATDAAKAAPTWSEHLTTETELRGNNDDG